MTEELLQKLEEKMMLLLSELEKVRGEVQSLKQENATLRAEQEQYTRKVQDMISLFDSVQVTHHTAA